MILYFAPTSFSSQIARLALVEKQVPFTAAVLDIHGTFENLSREYGQVNPKLVVPTLKHEETIVTDCHNIMKYVDKSFSGPDLGYPDEELMGKVIGIQTAVNEVLLSFSFVGPEKLLGILERKMAALQGLIDEGGDMTEVGECELPDGCVQPVCWKGRGLGFVGCFLGIEWAWVFLGV